MSSYGPFSRSTSSTVALRIITVADHVGRPRFRFGIDAMLMVTGCLRNRIDGPRSIQFMQEVSRHCLEHGWVLIRCPDPDKGWSLQKREALNTFAPVIWRPEFLNLIRSLTPKVPHDPVPVPVLVPVPVPHQGSIEHDKLREVDL